MKNISFPEVRKEVVEPKGLVVVVYVLRDALVDDETNLLRHRLDYEGIVVQVVSVVFLWGNNQVVSAVFCSSDDHFHYSPFLTNWRKSCFGRHEKDSCSHDYLIVLSFRNYYAMNQIFDLKMKNYSVSFVHL